MLRNKAELRKLKLGMFQWSANSIYYYVVSIQGGATGFNIGNREEVSKDQATSIHSALLLLSFSPFPVLNPAATPTL